MEYLLKKNLDNTSDRPIIYTGVANDIVIRCLINTGADTQVLASGERLFSKSEYEIGARFKNKRKLDKIYSFAQS